MSGRKVKVSLFLDERLILQLRKKGVSNLSALVEVFFEEFLRRYEPKEDRILRRNEIRQVFQELFSQPSTSAHELFEKFLEFLKHTQPQPQQEPKSEPQPQPKAQAISEPKQESKAQQKEPVKQKAKDPNALFGGRDRFEVMEEWMRELAQQYGGST